MSNDLTPPEHAKPRPGFLRAVLAVLWAFAGIRKGSESFEDQGVRPVHIIVAGVMAAASFVIILILIVRTILRAAT